MPTGQPAVITNFIFDFDGTLHTSRVQLYFVAILDHEEDTAFLEKVDEAGYELSQESVTAYYDKIMERLEKIDFNLPKQVADLNEAHRGFSKETKRRFANIINKLDPSLFARIIFLANRQLLNALITQMKNEGVKYLEVTLGSNRTTLHLDSLGMKQNCSMSAYLCMEYLAQFFQENLPGVDVKLNKFCGGDISNRLARGTSFDKIVAQHRGQSYDPALEEMDGIYDNQKLWLLYVIAQDAMTHYKELFPQLADHDNVEMRAIFFDDLKEIAFANYPPRLFPAKFSLANVHYNGAIMAFNPTFLIGTGDVDPCFAENSFVMMECAGYESKGELENEYDFLKQLNVDKFIANRITANAPRNAAVIKIDDYLENSVYENMVMYVLEEHGELLEACMEEMKEQGALSRESKNKLQCIVPGDHVITVAAHLNLSRLAQEEYGFHSLKSANEKWEALTFCKPFFADLLGISSFDEQVHYHHFLSLVASKVDFTVFRDVLLEDASMDANMREEILRDVSLSRFEDIVSKMGTEAERLKAMVILTAYLPLCALIKTKVEAAKCKRIYLETAMSKSNSLYGHIVYFSAFLMNHSSLNCRIGKWKEDGYKAVPIQLIAKREKVYQTTSNCLLWRSPPLQAGNQTSNAEAVSEATDESQRAFHQPVSQPR